MARVAVKNGYRQPHNMPDTYGAKQFDWDTGASFTNANGSSIDTTEYDPDGATKSLLLPYHASTSYCDADLDTAYAYLNLKSITFWAWKPAGQAARPIRCFISNNASFTGYYQLDCLIDKDGWNLYGGILNQQSGQLKQPRVQGTLTFASDTVSRIRFRQLDEEAQCGYANMATGESLRIGTVYFNYRSRPKFMIDTDDGFDAFSTDPFSGETIKSILDEYNFKGNLYVVTDFIGDATHESAATLQSLSELGFDICNHTQTMDTGNFVDDKTTAQEVTDEIEGATAALDSIGLTRASRFHALPQGRHDRKTWDGIEDALPVILATRGTVHGLQNFPSMGQAGTNDQNINTNTMYHPTVFNLGGSEQWDAATDVTARLEEYVDECIEFGATGSAYGHSLSTQIVLNLRALCDRLKLREEQGLIDVVTVSKWYNGQ